MVFDLALESHQQELRRAAQGLFSERCPRTTVRDVEAGTTGYLPDLWREMAELGWLGLALPGRYGGSDGDFTDLYVLFEELGRYLVPGPHLDTIGVAADLILSAGSADQKSDVLPRIADGSCVASVATVVSMPAGANTPDSSTVAERGGGYVLNGHKLLVGFAELATLFVVTARAGGTGAEGVTVLLVDASSPGIGTERLENISGTPLYAVSFEGVLVPSSAVVGASGGGWAAFARSSTKAALLQTSAIIGATGEVLDMTRQYAKDRVQFGIPIGKNQAVQYMVSDILIALHTMDVLGKHAAYRVGSGRTFEREAAMAIAHAKRSAAHLHRQAHEVHAGIGFMQEYDLQLFSRRSKYWEHNLGDARHYDEMVLAALS